MRAERPTGAPAAPAPATVAAPEDSARRLRPARLVILDAQGDTVRVLQGERKLGFNRVWWDLRYTAPATPKLRALSKTHRELDSRVQHVNWEVELMA